MADARGKPDALFFLTTSLDAAAVRARYESGGAEEAWESDRLALEPIGRLVQGQEQGQGQRAAPPGLPLTAVTRAALRCLAQMAATCEEVGTMLMPAHAHVCEEHDTWSTTPEEEADK